MAISINKTNLVMRLNEQQPRFYWSGVPGTISANQLDGWHLDMDRASFKVAPLAQQYTMDADPVFRTATITSSNSTFSVSGVNPVAKISSTGGVGFRLKLL